MLQQQVPARRAGPVAVGVLLQRLAWPLRLWVAGPVVAWVLLQRQLLLLLVRQLRLVGLLRRAGSQRLVGLLRVAGQLQQTRLRCGCVWRWIPWTGTRWSGCTWSWR
jgi:hypothetical protein